MNRTFFPTTIWILWTPSKYLLLIAFFCCSAIGFSNSSFSVELPPTTKTEISKKKKFEKKKRKRIAKSLKDKPNKYGKRSLWTLLAALFSFFLVPVTFLPIFILFGILLMIYSAYLAWKGTKYDEKPKLAERMLAIYLMLVGLFVIIIGWGIFLSFQ